MHPQEHHLTVSRTARYYTLGNCDRDLAEVWFVLHGHGYSAKHFIRHFRVLENARTLIVAPEALSRFYVNHEARRVGASWMTREDRLNEIADYVGYLDRLYAHLWETIDRSSVTVHVVGFSQGAAAACRWVAQGEAQIDRLTIWAGLVPPELDLTTRGLELRDAKLTVVLGNHDEYVDSSEAAEQEIKLRELGILHEFVRFEGGHVLDDDLLLTLACDRK